MNLFNEKIQTKSSSLDYVTIQQ
ncbi:hypothetical protein TcasGA2_TC006007 [Tribolium castaneum]|uniref:Uncharacterized protein n=1 Tax=Tribolium castaneum TaxID=7070 RepID=D6WUL0_TRICA|nr:hypothetical protein TcasGA2_TC006007 [Tribolium castaneum]